MSDKPVAVAINEEGPREGFQIESGSIATQRKVELIDALSETGLKHMQIVSFVNPKRVPGMADAEEVVKGIKPKSGVDYTALWLNERVSSARWQRGASRSKARFRYARLRNSSSATRTSRMPNRSRRPSSAHMYKEHAIPVERASVMAAFGCNFEGDIDPRKVVAMVDEIFAIAAEHDIEIKIVSFADTMAWATPRSIKRVIGAVRERYPDLKLSLHLHDTRGMAIANAYAGLEMGVDRYDASVAGLGGCPFAGHKAAAGNVCTEDLVFMCEEMGIRTGIDLERLTDCARLAEDIVGHPLPGSVMRGGTLNKLRAAAH